MSISTSNCMCDACVMHTCTGLVGPKTGKVKKLFAFKACLKGPRGPEGCSFSESARGYLDPFKNALKTNSFLTFPVFGPTKPVHVCMTHASHMKFDVDMLKVTSK